MGNEISTESISEENNKKNNNFNKNNSEDLNKIYIIHDLDKDFEKLYKNDDFNKDVSGHLMDLDFSDINEINDDYLFNNIGSNNVNSQINSSQVNSKMVSQNMVCNNGQCKLRTKECVNNQCRFKDESFDIKRNKPINLSDDTKDENTSFKRYIQKYNQSFNDYNDKTEKKDQLNDKIMNLHLKKQLNNSSLLNSLLPNSSISYNETSPLKEEFTQPNKTKYFQDSETIDEDVEPKRTYYDSNYPDNSLSSISDVFWKRSIF